LPIPDAKDRSAIATEQQSNGATENREGSAIALPLRQAARSMATGNGARRNRKGQG